MKTLSLVVTVLAGGNAESISSEAQNKVNPIRKVVTMLQMMQNKVSAEGAKKQEIYDKFMCYCDNADTLLGGAITAAENKIPQLESAIGGDGELKKQLDADIIKHKSDKDAANEAIATATALREKEATAFAKESGDLKTNIDALEKAIPAIEKGMGGFLQTKAATVLQQLSVSMDMGNVDRQMLTAFLTSKSGYAPASGEIVGILKTMKDEMVANLEQSTADENAAIAALEELKMAKTKEINALQSAIEAKMTRVGELGVKVAEMVNDLEDTKEDLEESKKFLADLDVNCENKKKEWAAYQKMQGEELLALADTIKVLNDDDALELFKKTLPGSSASLLQVSVSSKAMAAKALNVLRTLRTGNDPRVDFLEVALRGGKAGFEKIIKLIDELVVQLKKEQEEDDTKKDYCDNEFDKTEDKAKVLANEASDLETAISDEEESISNLKAEIEALDDGIRALDKEVEEATETRKEEHDEFTATSAANAAAVDLLKFAKNRLNKFYNPSQYKAPPKRQLSEDEQITLNMGGTLAPTEAPGGIAGTGIGFVQAHNGAAPPPPPAADLAYKTKGEESSGVITMIDTLVNDVEKEMQVAKLEEKDAQSDYEKFMDDAGAKRAEDSKSMTDKEGALADTQDSLVNNKEALKNKNFEQMETEKYMGELHEECDWLLKYYDVRKEARTGEIDAMGKAKDVLNGADYSL
jgi:predicted  nucleic acid-binding Zn-ribbon protein